MAFFRGLFKKRKQPSIQEMVLLLLDKSVDVVTRDDIAMYLGSSDDPLVEHSLLQVVLDQSDDAMVVDSAADSLREIWVRRGKHEPQTVAQMHPAARHLFSLSTQVTAALRYKRKRGGGA